MYESMPVSIEQRTRRKHASRPLGRRAVLWAVGLFLVSQAALGLFLAHDGFAVRDPVRHGRLKMLRDRIAEAPSPPKVVVLLGSSHVDSALRARQMSLEVSEALCRPVVVANQGVSGGGAFRSLLAVDRLLHEGIVPDLVVLETFPAMFNDTPAYNDATEAALPLELLDEADVELLRRYAVDRPDLGADRRGEELVPGYGYRANLGNYLLPWLLPSGRRRSAPPEEEVLEETTAERREKGLANSRKEYYPRLQNLTLGDPRQMRAVGELVEDLRSRGAKVVFLAMPEGPTFRSWYPADRRAKSVVWLRDLAAARGVPSIDARDWSDREETFSDSHHLTRDGSEQFSRWLGREVLVPQLRAGR